MREHLNQSLAERYLVERELGRGGMASVWMARDLRHERPVAIKVLHPELAGAIGVDRFVREVRLTALLQHPHIIPVLDSGVFPGPSGVPLPWYAMPHVTGESLRERLHRERQLPVEEALRLVAEAAGALEAAHRQGIVHRDIKPENLLLAGGHVYVADFGIAKALVETGGERLTSTGLAIGTPAYMSPEQSAADMVDARSDQYSLAVVLYEMLAGEPPFTGPTAQAVVARRLAEPARPLRPVRPSVPEAVEAAILRALERVPGDRFESVAEFRAALMDSRAAVRRRARPTRRAGVLLGGVVLVATLALAAWLAARSAGPAPVVRDSVAVALYQRGMQSYDKRTPAAIGEAIQALTAAVTRDSAYTDAWVGLAMTYVRAYQRHFAFPGVPRDSVLRLAVAAVDRAFALNRGDADVWVARGIVSGQVDPTDVGPGLRMLRQALVLDSLNATAWHVLAIGQAENGDLEAALAAWRRSVAVDPSYTQGLAFLGLGHFWRHQYDSAAHWIDSAIAVDPNYLLARRSAGEVAIERGDWRRARASFDAAQRLSTDIELVNALAGNALTEARAGAPREAWRLAQEAESLAAGYTPAPLHTAVYLAQAYGALAERGRAVEWLRRFAPSASLHFQLHLRCDPSFAPLQDDPGFRALLIMPRPEGAAGC